MGGRFRMDASLPKQLRSFRKQKMGNKDLSPRERLLVFNQTVPMTARGGDAALAEEDTRVNAGAQPHRWLWKTSWGGALHRASDSCHLTSMVSLSTWEPGGVRTHFPGGLKPGASWFWERDGVLWMNVKLCSTSQYTKAALGKSQQRILPSSKHSLQSLLKA